MDIQLSTEAQRFIEAQLRDGPYGTPAEVIDALVREKLGCPETPANADLAARQRATILQVIQECEALAPPPHGEQFSNREHDRVLYGK